MNNLELCMRPGAESVSWTEFRCSHPAGSIALDGYVCAPSQYDPRGPWLNFDHHADVDRLSSRATCAQVLIALRQGLLERDAFARQLRTRVFVNDCDEDVCLSWYLLTNHQWVRSSQNGDLDRLVQAVDLLDTTAGACLQPLDENLLREIAWIFEPYRTARLRGSLDAADEAAYRAIVNDVHRRIAAHLDGSGGVAMLDLRYRQILKESGWSMVAEIGAQARLGMVRNGIRAYVSVRERSDGLWSYSLGRTSPFVAFDVPALVAALNQAEHAELGTWGGGNLIAGSPRQYGSRLPPGEVATIVEEMMLQSDAHAAPFPRGHRTAEFAAT